MLGRRFVLLSLLLSAMAPAAHAEPGPAAAAQAAEETRIRPFRVEVPEHAIADLRRRIRETRWSDKETVADNSQGLQLSALQEIMRHWGSGYDWRKAEAKLNAYPQFTTKIDGLDIHFIHVRSRHKGALPLIMTHGWPGSVFGGRLLRIKVNGETVRELQPGDTVEIVCDDGA